MQLYSLQVDVNRPFPTLATLIIDSLSLFKPHHFFENHLLASLRIADIKRDTRRPQATDSVSFSLTEMGNTILLGTQGTNWTQASQLWNTAVRFPMKILILHFFYWDHFPRMWEKGFPECWRVIREVQNWVLKCWYKWQKWPAQRQFSPTLLIPPHP